MRVADADRTHAVELLGVQAGAGRITLAELDERTGTAYTAVTLDELRHLFCDLPIDPDLPIEAPHVRICGLLATAAAWVEHAALADAAGISDPVLATQSRALHDAGYLDIRTGALGRRARTWLRLTPDGRATVAAHLAWLQQDVQARAP
jgi:hypothetical protein